MVYIAEMIRGVGSVEDRNAMYHGAARVRCGKRSRKRETVVELDSTTVAEGALGYAEHGRIDACKQCAWIVYPPHVLVVVSRSALLHGLLKKNSESRGAGLLFPTYWVESCVLLFEF